MAEARAREFLLEIGCEEIPAGWLEDLTRQLKERFAILAEQRALVPALEPQTHGTPRRLVLSCWLPDRQPDRTEDVWGPALSLAKGADGRWTNAAEGFARKHSLPSADALLTGLKLGKDGKNQEHVRVRLEQPGRDAAELLPELIASTLRALSFPKKMSWDAWLDDGKGAFPFGRPIRWLVALLGGEVVPFTIFVLESGAKGRALVESGASSRGHRFLPRGAADARFAVSGFDSLCTGLRAHGVLLLREERLAAIQRALEPVRAELQDDHGLLADWASLVEHPNVVFGAIPPEFHALPRELVETVLVHHQKYVPLVAGGRVLRFAAITNIDADASAEIVRGMQRVVVARLRDAAFFYAEDRKRALADRVPDLAGVAFHQKLGSYGEKAERMVRLVAGMGEAGEGWLDPRQGGLAETAARLAKADLTTLLVREFTELQGVVGGLYLQAEGASTDVAAAVRWHYHPLSIEESAPPAGSLPPGDVNVWGAVSLADKLDTLAGYFGIGLVPTGSSDPFGLRRAAQGAVRVLLDFWQAEATGRPSLRALAELAVAGHGARLARPAADVRRDLEAFLLDRLRYVLTARGFAADGVDAALGAREPDALDDPREALVRLRALREVRGEAGEAFEALAVAFKRARNILGERPPGAPDPALFEHDAERRLHAAALALRDGGGDYAARLRALARLREPVDAFFDDVMVMVEDPRVRDNRLGLLSQVLSLFYRIADISRLGGTQ